MILYALRFYFKHKLSLRETKQELKIRFTKINPHSHVTILKWANKLSYLLSISLLNPTFNLSSCWPVWCIVETVIKINGLKYYLIVVLDYYSGCVISWFLSTIRDAQSAQYPLSLAKQITKSSPNFIISDHALNIILAVVSCFNNSTSHFQVDLYFSNTFYNNKLERFFSNIKSKLISRKTFKSFNSAVAFFVVLFYLHNTSKSTPYIPQLSKTTLVRSFLLCLA